MSYYDSKNMTSTTNDIILKMNNLLQNMDVETVKNASFNTENSELSSFASSLIQISDQIDAIGMNEAVEAIDNVLLNLAKEGIVPNFTKQSNFSNISYNFLLKSAINTLIDLSDKFDKLGKTEISNNLDQSLEILSKVE